MYIDLHNDTILKIIHENLNFAKGGAKFQIDLPKILASKIIGGLFFALFCDPMFKGDAATQNVLDMKAKLERGLAECGDRFRIVLSKNDIQEAMAAKKIMALIAIEGGLAINEDIANLEMFYEKGVRSMTLTHTASLSWAGSQSDKLQKGLNDFGRDVVKKMNELGMIVDVAHVSEQTIFDAVEVSKKPIVCTHTAAKKVYDNERCLSDDAIKAIASTGGVVGIIFFSEFLEANPFSDNSFMPLFMKEMANLEKQKGLSAAEKSQKVYDLYTGLVKKPEKLPGAEAVFNHIDHIVNLVGEDFVGLGSDFDGVPYSCAGLEDISKIGNLVSVFKKNGYSTARIEKILSGNILRVMRECL